MSVVKKYENKEVLIKKSLVKHNSGQPYFNFCKFYELACTSPLWPNVLKGKKLSHILRYIKKKFQTTYF